MVEQTGQVNSPEPDPLVRIGLLLCAVLPFGTIAWAYDLFRSIGLNLFEAQFYAGMLGLGFAAMFLVWTPRGRKRTRVEAILDILLAGIATACCWYLAVQYPGMVDRIYEAPIDALIIGAVILVVTLEGIRRTTGLILALVVLSFVVFALLGHHVPGDLQGRNVRFDRLLGFVATDTNAVFGLAMRVCTTIVIAFILFGSLLSRSGGSQFFSRLSAALFGRLRGGSAKISVVASGLFGSISGSAVSNVLSTGVMTIPMMRRSGYPATSAAAVEAVASTGGQIMPPVMGAAAFLMAEFLQTSYTDVVIAALIPALLYYTALFMLVDLEAARLNVRAVDEKDIEPIWPVLKSGWHFFLPFVVLIVALFQFNVAPEMSALYGCLTLLAGWIIRGNGVRRFQVADIIPVLKDTGKASVQLLMICAGAGVIIGMLNISALGFALALFVVLVGKANLFLLLILAAGICIILGMGMPTAAVYILLATLIAPALIELGISQMAAHLFVLYFGMMSMTTPPVAIAAFAASTISGTSPMKTAWVTTKYAWSAYVIPFLFVLSPTLLFDAGWLEIAVTVAASIGGIWLVTGGIIGYLTGPLNNATKLWAVLAGAALLAPASAIPYGLAVNGAGAIAGIALYVSARRRLTNGSPA